MRCRLNQMNSPLHRIGKIKSVGHWTPTDVEPRAYDDDYDDILITVEIKFNQQINHCSLFCGYSLISIIHFYSPCSIVIRHEVQSVQFTVGLPTSILIIQISCCKHRVSP